MMTTLPPLPPPPYKKTTPGSSPLPSILDIPSPNEHRKPSASTRTETPATAGHQEWPSFSPSPWHADHLPSKQALNNQSKPSSATPVKPVKMALPPPTYQQALLTPPAYVSTKPLNVQVQPSQSPSVQGAPPSYAQVIRQTTPAASIPWKNDLKDLFHRNEAVIYALNIRTFGAHDDDGDGRISVRQGENGTFLSAVKNLDQLTNLGINTIHLFPINPIGKNRRMGEGGSLYAPSDYHSINPEFDTPGNATNAEQEAKIFVDECHKRGIRVMVDVPSCASADLAQSRPDLILKDRNGKTLTPTNWIDIVMFKNDKALRDYYEGFFDMMANRIGVDGFRVDVARARTPDFWQYFTSKYPDKAWLAESYCQEDQSPLKNLPRDIPEDLLKSGFDSYYGQFHIFHSMQNAKEYMDYLLSNRAMFQRASRTGGNDKSFIGSFQTHDDPSLMEHGGALQCMLATGLMTTQPWTNPYMIDGFTTGYPGDYDIFNYVPQHKGSHPEIGLMMRHMLQLRKAYSPVLTQGAFIPIPVNGGDNNQVIAFARQAQGKTLLVVANKDVNAQQKATLAIPGLNPTQPMTNLVPGYGRPSYFYPGTNQMSVDLGPGRFHVFEINTPNLAQQLPSY
jgi:glycosidase